MNKIMISEATQTKITVRAKAKDAKFIGSTMAGALVVIKDSDTGEVLAKGFTTGGTGNIEVLETSLFFLYLRISPQTPQHPSLR